MSKQGCKAPRQILYMIALSAIQYNPLIRQLYEKTPGTGNAQNGRSGHLHA